MTSPNQNPLVEPTTTWKPCTVMVTGASGFLGSHLCRHLGMRGGEVHAISRSQQDRQKSGPIWWQSNLEDVDAVRRIFDSVKPDIIFHLSGLVSGIQNKELVLPTFHSLLTSTVNLLTVAAEVGCQRIVLAGSLNEPPDDGESIPSSPYAAAKWASSGYGRMFHALYGTPVVIVRTFMTYGPGQEMRKLIPTVALSLLKGESPKLSSGQWKADWIYVDDVIEGFLAAAQVPHIEGATVDLGSGSLVTVRELVERLVEVVGKGVQPLFGVLPDRVMEPARMAEVARTFERLDWRPKVSLENGLRQTVEWYKSQFFGSKNSQLPGHSNK